MAASATLALKAGACVRRTRLVMVAPDPRHPRRSQAEFPLIDLSEFGRPPLTQPPPSRLRPISRFRRLYDLPCSGDFSPGRGGLLQLLSMSLSPCCRFHPAEVTSRIGQCSAGHSAFATALEARPSGIHTFEATMRSLLLRPGDS